LESENDVVCAGVIEFHTMSRPWKQEVGVLAQRSRRQHRIRWWGNRVVLPSKDQCRDCARDWLLLHKRDWLHAPELAYAVTLLEIAKQSWTEPRLKYPNRCRQVLRSGESHIFATLHGIIHAKAERIGEPEYDLTIDLGELRVVMIAHLEDYRWQLGNEVRPVQRVKQPQQKIVTCKQHGVGLACLGIRRLEGNGSGVQVSDQVVEGRR